MATATSGELEKLEQAYRDRVQEIRAAPLSWEKKELTVRRLGLEYDRPRKQLKESE